MKPQVIVDPSVNILYASFYIERLYKIYGLQALAPSWSSISGLTLVTRRSGSSIRGERVCRTGNKRLKHAMFLSAFASLTDPVSRTYYQRKRDQGKRLGPGPARPGPPPHPHPARHDPRRSPLRPATSHETTRSRLIHHIGAPPGHDAKGH